MINDGGGLYLRANEEAGSWSFRYKKPGAKTATDVGLGTRYGLTLAGARKVATELRQARGEGLDPQAVYRERYKPKAKDRNTITFGEASTRYIEAHETEWTNKLHHRQWVVTLTETCAPLSNMNVDAIDTYDVLKILIPKWTKNPNTSRRVRGRIESILDWATAKKYRQGENPARWKGNLDNLLASQPKSTGVIHHPSMDYQDVPKLMEELIASDFLTAVALRFLILTASRAGEVVGAQWDEISIKDKTWVVPAIRMKGRREHRVPLSAKAMRVIMDMRALKVSGHVFPSHRGGHLHPASMVQLLRRIGYREPTVHGFRSSFRNWSDECTAYPHTACEQALAHSVGSDVERAYRRSDLLDIRASLMEDWGRYCCPDVEGQKNTK